MNAAVELSCVKIQNWINAVSDSYESSCTGSGAWVGVKWQAKVSRHTKARRSLKSSSTDTLPEIVLLSSELMRILFMIPCFFDLLLYCAVSILRSFMMDCLGYA
jgi:hypothetical protein